MIQIIFYQFLFQAPKNVVYQIFCWKPTAKRGNISIEKVLYIKKKQALKAVLVNI